MVASTFVSCSFILVVCVLSSAVFAEQSPRRDERLAVHQVEPSSFDLSDENMVISDKRKRLFEALGRRSYAIKRALEVLNSRVPVESSEEVVAPQKRLFEALGKRAFEALGRRSNMDWPESVESTEVSWSKRAFEGLGRRATQKRAFEALGKRSSKKESNSSEASSSNELNNN